MLDRLIPTEYRLLAAALAAVVLAAGAAFAAWTARGWQADRDLSMLREQHATAHANQADQTLARFSTAATVINNAALDATQAQQQLAGDLARIAADRKQHATTHPLPADCRPDPGRVHQREAAIDAVNAQLSAAGQ